MTTELVPPLPHVDDQDFVDRVIAGQLGRPGALLGILEQLQDRNRHKYLPMETLAYVAARTGLPESQVFSVATFFALFNLEPQGTHTVAICRGTACHTRGSRALLERVKLQLGVDHDAGGADTVAVRTVACFGQCALAPVVEIDHAIRGHVKEQTLIREVEALRRDAGR